MTRDSQPLPLRSDLFRLELEGKPAGGFTRLSGLAGTWEMLYYDEGGAEVPRRIPDRVLWEPLVLERGLACGRDLWDWFVSGEARDGDLIVLDALGRERARWRFRAGRAVRWIGPELDASVSTLALERLEIVHEGLEWAATT